MSQLTEHKALGFLPTEWDVKPLNEVTKVYDGTHQTPKYVEQGIPFYSVEHVTANDFSKTKFITSEVFEKENARVQLEKGDILMTRIGDVGTVKYIDWDVEASFYVSLALIKQQNSFNSKYLSQFLKGKAFQKELWKKIIHTAFPRKINLGEIGKCYIALPPLPEQQKIAEILSTVDEKIEIINQQIIETEQLKKGMMQRLLTKGVDHTEFKDSKLGKIPKSWEVVKIEDIADVKGGKRLPKGESLQEKSTDHPYIRVADMRMGGVDSENILYVPNEVFPSISRYIINIDDLFISVAGTLGIVGEIPIELDGANLTENADKLTNLKVDKSFLLQVLLSPIVQNAVEREKTNNAQPKLALSRIRTFLVPKPSKIEQQKIAEILSAVDDKLEVLVDKKEEYQQLKKGLMQQLLTGKARVKV